MNILYKFIVSFIADIGAGLGTGFAGMSAAAVISPIIITFFILCDTFRKHRKAQSLKG